MGKVNMRDVAEHAGVSVATVSHVINNTRFVGDETRQHVIDSIEALGYCPNMMARIFKTGKKQLIGFIVPDIANSFFSTIIEEVENTLASQNYKLIIANTKENPEREIENLKVLSGGIVDGIIIASTLDNYEEMEKIIPKELPCVCIDRNVPNYPYDNIIISSYQAARLAVETVIKEGHQKIGYIAGLSRLSTTKERLSAYEDALNAADIPLNPNFVCYGDSMSNSATNHVDKLISQGCTAIVVSNNVMAEDVMFYLQEKKVAGGKRIRLVTYNDSSQIKYPFSHTHVVCQPVIELGRIAGTQMMERIDNPTANIKNIVLQSTFIPCQYDEY